jgi:hypothetical protein
MRKFCVGIVVLALCLCSGCSSPFQSKEEEPSPTEAFKGELLSSLVVDASSDASIDKKHCLERVYKEVKITSITTENDGFKVDLELPGFKGVAERCINDSSGFISDINNLVQLNESKENQIDYVYRYVSGVLSGVEDKSKMTFSVSGDSIGVIAKGIETDYCDNLVNQIYSYVVDGEAFSFSVNDTAVTEPSFEVGKGKVMWYSDGDKKYKVFICPKVVLEGDSARNKLIEVSDVNKEVDFTGVDPVYLEYSVTNLEDEDLNYTNKFCLVDEQNFVHKYSGVKFIGVNPNKVIKANSEDTVSVVLIKDEDNLSVGWYDSAEELFIALNNEVEH